MSFTPGDGELWREAIGGREVEAEMATRDYAHLHPEADSPLPKRPHKLIEKLLGRLRRDSAE